MTTEHETLDSLNEETQIDDTIELDALKEKYQDISSKNKQLFERAKKAEGELKEVKAKISESPKPEPKETKPDNVLLQKLERVTLRTAGIVAEDEVELARSLQKKTGLDIEDLVEDDYFKSKLESLRTTKSNATATANITGGTGGAEKDPAHWASKMVDGQFPEGMPRDLATRAKVLDIALANAKTGGKTFYND